MLRWSIVCCAQRKAAKAAAQLARNRQDDSDGTFRANLYNNRRASPDGYALSVDALLCNIYHQNCQLVIRKSAIGGRLFRWHFHYPLFLFILIYNILLDTGKFFSFYLINKDFFVILLYYKGNTQKKRHLSFAQPKCLFLYNSAIRGGSRVSTEWHRGSYPLPLRHPSKHLRRTIVW